MAVRQIPHTHLRCRTPLRRSSTRSSPSLSPRRRGSVMACRSGPSAVTHHHQPSNNCTSTARRIRLTAKRPVPLPQAQLSSSDSDHAKSGESAIWAAPAATLPCKSAQGTSTSEHATPSSTQACQSWPHSRARFVSAAAGWRKANWHRTRVEMRQNVVISVRTMISLCSDQWCKVGVVDVVSRWNGDYVAHCPWEVCPTAKPKPPQKQLAHCACHVLVGSVPVDLNRSCLVVCGESSVPVTIWPSPARRDTEASLQGRPPGRQERASNRWQLSRVQTILLVNQAYVGVGVDAHLRAQLPWRRTLWLGG